MPADGRHGDRRGTRRRVLVILNPASRGYSRARGIEGFTAMQAALVRAGMEVEVRSPEPSRTTLEARRAASEFDVVAAAGGDGTVGAVAAALAGTLTPLAVLPLGTRNHFARDAGIPTDPTAVAKAIADGSTRAVDLGEANGRVFVNNASMGLYPRILRSRDEIRERLGTRKWPAFAAAAARTLRRPRPLQVDLHSNGNRRRLETPFVFVGNNPYAVELFSLGRRERLDGGRLGVYATRRTGRFALLRLSTRTLLHRLDQSKDFLAETATEIVVHADRPKVTIALDGEAHPFSSPIEFRTRPGALQVIAPIQEGT